MEKNLLLVDGSSYLYRAYYAVRGLTASDGTPTNAVYGVLNMLRQLNNDVAYDFCACVFDSKGKNFRHEMFADYKANRPPMPDDLRPQAEILPKLIELLGWNVLKINGVEADDVIGTLAVQAAAQKMHVIIATGDKDMAQLVNKNIVLLDTMKNKNEFIDAAAVWEKFGVYPHQIRDFLALMGDKSDNVPGVEKCGEKTAAKWLSEFGSLDEIMKHANEFKGKIGENLRAAIATQLPLSYQLVTIKTDVDLHENLPNGVADLVRHEANWHELAPHFRALNFKKWLAEAEKNLSENHDLFAEKSFRQPENIAPTVQNIVPNIAAAPEQLNYQTIDTEEKFETLLVRLKSAERIALDTETHSLDPMAARLVGISVAFAAGEAAYIPLAHSLAQQLNLTYVLGCLKPFLEDENLGKIGQNLKYDQHVFKNHGIDLKGIIGDAMLASYLIESHKKHNLDDLAARWLNLPTISYEDLCGKGAKQMPFADVSVEQATEYACQDADFTWRIEAHLHRLMNTQQLEMYEKMELPTAQVLFVMERHGVKIDRQELAAQSHELGAKLVQLEQQAFELVGQPFNLNSPKQLQEILFTQMGIPTKGIKKTASGGYSTDESVLEKLADDYPLPKILLENRSLSKLKSTYTDKLPEMVNPETNRIHTNYAQAVTVTGRLASNNPNLQNIPIRTAEGRRVRRAFVAPENFVMVSADYSQIELRIMAHLSGDETLINAFKNNEDVHRRTAAEVFGMPPESISPEQRRYAKTINFGLIYGMSEYGLAKSLGIDAASAKVFIQRYFARYHGVADYMNRMRESAHELGYVETLFGRRLYLPDIHASGIKRAAAERAAINAPMQGTASDLIKKAMIAVQEFLLSGSLKSRLVMQVHDELVLEGFESEIDLIKEKLPEIMASVGVGALCVPLLAEVGMGQNWDDAH